MSSKAESINKDFSNLHISADSKSHRNKCNARVEINSKPENNDTKSLYKKPKIKELHLECLKKYLKEDKFIGPTEAMRKLKKETSLEVSVDTVRKSLIKLREGMDPDYANPDPIKSAKMSNNSKLNALHYEHLKMYLKKNANIGNTEARNLLYSETGLNVSVPTVRIALIKLEKEIAQEDSVLRSSELKTTAIREPWIYGIQLKDLHIECLKRYLIENSSIGVYKARTKLKKDTGLEISIHTMKKALLAIKQEINQEVIESPIPGFKAKVRCRSKGHGFKIKDSHLECLKKYINENNSIGPTYARDRLYKETGLEVSITAIHNTLVELKEQYNINQVSTLSPTSKSGTKSKPWNYGRKLKILHVDCLKKYLNEDISIGSTIAKNRLIEETGIDISVFPVQQALIKLRKELNQDGSNTSIDSISNTKIKSRDSSYALKDLHLECIKKYLLENKFIGPTETKNRLKSDTELIVCISTIRRALVKLRKEMGIKYTEEDLSKLKNTGPNNCFKINEFHLECLKRYLKENNFIGPTEAKKKLEQDTGLNIHVKYIGKVLLKLKSEIYLH